MSKLEFVFPSTTIRSDEMVNATALTTAYRNATGIRKDCAKWLKTKEAEESIAYLERVTQKVVAETQNIPTTKLVIVEHGVGTWMHPDLAEIFAQWVSVEYRFAVVDLIRNEKAKKVQPQPQPERQLAPQRDLIDYVNACHLVGLQDDPIIKSLLSQRMAEQLSPGVRAIEHPEQPLNITSIASNLGYSQAQIGTGAALGKYVAYRHQSLGTSQHGRYQVKVYLPSEVSSTVDEFFNSSTVVKSSSR